MKINIRYIAFLLCLSGINKPAFSQDYTSDVTVTCDKNKASDTLWITATRKTSDNPGSLMLVTGSQKFDQSDTAFFPLMDSVCNFALLVPETFRSGNFTVKAYYYPKIFQVSGYVNGKSKSDKLVVLMLTNNKKLYNKILEIDEGGHFVLPNLVFEKKASLIFNYINVKKKIKPDLTIEQSPSADDFTSCVFSREFDMTPDSVRAVNDSLLKAGKILPKQTFTNDKAKLLKEVTLTVQKKSKIEQFNELYTTELFRDINEKVINCLDNDDILSYPDCLSFLRTRVAGLTVITGKFGDNILKWRGHETKAFYIDEMEVDLDQILNLDIDNIAMIKTFPPPFTGGAGNGDGGAIAVYTRQGEFQRENFIDRRWLFSVKGYTAAIHELFEKK